MKNDPYHELVAKADRHHQRLGSLEEELRDRTGNLNDIRDRLRKLETNIGEHSIRAIVSKIDDGEKSRQDELVTGQPVREDRGTAPEHRDSARQIRVSSGLPHAGFDTWQQISPEMITPIRKGLATTPVPETKLQQLRNSGKARRRSSSSGTSRCGRRSGPSGC